MSHFSLHALRTLRNMLVPAPASMANARQAYSGQPLSEDEVMPQQTIASNIDLAAASRQHAPGRWAYSAETLSMRNNYPTKGKTKGHSKGKQFLGNPNTSSNAASAALPRSEVVDTIVGSFAPPIPSTEVFGHGPYWINHVRYIQLSSERTVADTDPLNAVNHDIGQCPRTLYFSTGTCLNDIEVDLLLQACVIVPNNAAFEYYMRHKFRNLCTPPWVRHTSSHKS